MLQTRSTRWKTRSSTFRDLSFLRIFQQKKPVKTIHRQTKCCKLSRSPHCNDLETEKCQNLKGDQIAQIKKREYDCFHLELHRSEILILLFSPKIVQISHFWRIFQNLKVKAGSGFVRRNEPANSLESDLQSISSNFFLWKRTNCLVVIQTLS